MSRTGVFRHCGPRTCPAWPAFILTAGNDVLCDEGEAYARRLQQHGVPVQLRHYPVKSTAF
jgi:acetyl esterase